MMKKQYLIFASLVVVIFGTMSDGQEKDTLELLLEKNAFDMAEVFCAQQNQKDQRACYIRLGDAYLKNKEFEKAGESYEKIHYNFGLNTIGDHYLSIKDFQKAREYYEKGKQTARMAYAFGRMADQFRDKGDAARAKESYGRAVSEYEKAIKTFNFQWKPEYSEDRKRCMREMDRFPKSEEEKAQQTKLVKILKRCSRYCKQLEEACIYFFCHEEIVQKGDYSRRKLDNIMALPSETRTIFYHGRRRVIKPRKSTRTYLYEYQLIKEKPEDEALEQRILIEKDGKERRKENAKLETAYYKHEKVLFGPVGLLNSYWQRFYDYKIVGEEELEGEKTIIIEAIPTLERGNNTLFGKVWVKAGDFSIVKIEWNPKSVQYIHAINLISELYKETPSIVFVSEFNKERNGIRFPTRFYIEEAYINDKGEKFIRLRTDVTYKDYQFFNVQVGEIEYETPQ